MITGRTLEKLPGTQWLRLQSLGGFLFSPPPSISVWILLLDACLGGGKTRRQGQADQGSLPQLPADKPWGGGRAHRNPRQSPGCRWHFQSPELPYVGERPPAARPTQHQRSDPNARRKQSSKCGRRLLSVGGALLGVGGQTARPKLHGEACVHPGCSLSVWLESLLPRGPTVVSSTLRRPEPR